MGDDPKNPRIRAALYCRVSSGHQEQEATVESQREAVRAFADAQGYTVVEEFVDEAYSGATLDRPALDRLRDRAHARAFDTLVVLHPDRLARKTALLLCLLEELPAVGVTVQFLQGQPADTPEGRLFVTMQGGFAEYERAKITERTRRGKLYWAKRGGLMGGYVPYGYRYLPRNGETRATLIPDPTTADIVRTIFALLIDDGASCRRIARTLTERGVPTPGHSDHWRESTVNRLLRQTAYAGQFIYHRWEYGIVDLPERNAPASPPGQRVRRMRPPSEWVTVPVPALVSTELFAAAERQLAANAQFSPRNNKQFTYLLKGLARCGRCGMAFTGAASRGHRYYGCTAFDPHNVGERKACRPRPIVNADALETVVWDAVSDLFIDPELLQAEFARRQDGGEADPDARRAQEARKTCGVLQRQQNRVLDLYQVEEIDREELVRRLAGLQRQQRDAEAILRELTERRDARGRQQDAAAGWLAWVETVRQGLDSLDVAGRQQLLRQVLSRVIVDVDEGRVTIETVLPVSTLPSGPGGSTQPRSRAQLRSTGADPCIERGPSRHRRRIFVGRHRRIPFTRLLEGRTELPATYPNPTPRGARCPPSWR